MTSDPELAARLLPELPGWTAEPASFWRGEACDLLRRVYHRGRAEAALEVTAGPSAANVVAMMMNFALGDVPAGKGGSRTWMLQGRKAHLVLTDRGMAYSLAVILRGGPGDLAGSVLLQLKGRALRPDVAAEVASALDWDAVTTALAGQHPSDAARMASAAHPPPVPAPSARTPALWPMLPSLHVMDQVDKLGRRRPPRFAIANMDLVADATRTIDERHAGLSYLDRDPLRFEAMPTPALLIAQRRFAPDYIWWGGLHFASARLRDAFGLGPEAVEYRNVDASGSTAEARAADYKAFRVVQRADPVDLVRMYGHEPDREADGSPTTAWVFSVSGPHATPRRTVWREGFVPPAPLFSDRLGRLLATDALAERVMAAGLTDVVFQDVTSEASLHGFTVRPGPPAGGQDRPAAPAGGAAIRGNPAPRP